MFNYKNSSKNIESGQSLIELALVMVFLLLLVAGIVDIGRAFFTYISLRDAAQEGALVGSIDYTTTCTTVIDRVRSTSTGFPIDLSDDTIVDISCNIPDPYCAGEDVGVTVSHGNFQLTMPLIGTVIGSQTITITASITDTTVTGHPDPSICPP